MKRVDPANPKTPRYYRRWSPRDDERLRLAWGDGSLAAIAKSLGRTEIATYWRARKLGLTNSPPQGLEYLTAAADRTGFETSPLRRILRAAGVALQPAMSRPGVVARGSGPRRGLHYHLVEPGAVDDAVAAWARQESVEEAASRRGVSGDVLRRLLLKAGHTPPRRRKARWRIPSRLADELVRAWRAKGASVGAHARRVGVGRVTLAGWLRAAGVLGPKRPGVEVRLDQELVDLVVEAKRPSCRAWRRAA